MITCHSEGRMASFPRVPINPRLTFGESIEKVCTRGRLHPGLKELFTKAYFSAHQSECMFYDDGTAKENDVSSTGAWIFTILKFAQGNVAVRLSLKQRLETGRWLMPLHVPPAAPLWLIRHFLGRLQTPLILCLADHGLSDVSHKKMWLRVSNDCHATMHQLTFNQKIHATIQTRIAFLMDKMQLEACLTLISLVTLIRNLSLEPRNGWIDKYAVMALVDYFAPALISRPYRPGYLTKEDKRCRAALWYLCHNLPEIQALCKRPATRNNVHLMFDSLSSSSILQSHKNVETPPARKKLILEDTKTQIPTKVCSGAENHQLKIFLTPVSRETQTENDTVTEEPMSELMEAEKLPLNGKSDREDGGGTEPDCKLLSSNLVKEDVLASSNSAVSGTSHFPTLTLPLKAEGKVANNMAAVKRGNCETGEIVAECNPEKKCHAVKLAYKLRGQWLAWRLAGLFLDGATSPVSPFGYTKLPNDLMFV